MKSYITARTTAETELLNRDNKIPCRN